MLKALKGGITRKINRESDEIAITTDSCYDRVCNLVSRLEEEQLTVREPCNETSTRNNIAIDDITDRFRLRTNF